MLAMFKPIPSVPIAASLIAASSAFAGPVPSPTRILIPTVGQTAVVTITNDEVEARRYVLTPVTWNQGEDGAPRLTPTNEISVTPRELVLAAGAQATVQIRATAEAPSQQRAYRITMRPADFKPDMSVAVQVIPVIDFPVFVGSGPRPAALLLEGIDVRNGSLAAKVINSGDAYARPRTVTLVGRSPRGQETFRQSWEGWYILAGGVRRYQATIDKAQCAATASFEVELTLDDQSRTRTVTPWRADTCSQIALPSS